MTNFEKKIAALVMCDKEYQQLLKECMVLEKEYLRIASALPKQDREKLDRYISACEELEYRRCTIAATVKTDSLV